MSHFEPIHQVSAKLGLTSRTLRHWEEKELFYSQRDPQSGWRIYNAEALQRVRFVLLLRELDIPIKSVKIILDSADPQIAAKIIKKQIDKLNEENIVIAQRKDLLGKYLSVLNSMQPLSNASQSLVQMEETLAFQLISTKNMMKQWEEIIMTNDTITSGALRIVILPAMRVAVCNVISASPEDEALEKVLRWAELENLIGTANIFGFNTTEYSPGSSEYGWSACVSVPEQVILPEHLEEKRLPGGLYASLNSTNEVYDSWQILMRLLKESNEYAVDESRPCLEELIRSGEDKIQGKDFYLNLLEPVHKK
ncbi:MerR family transcriptional regulator [Clostridium estertheticum]|uniref:MerR family transcriptional regulator n=1 Tax=Clostridium estertheticum TaxID=238834 RepID=UPI001C0E00B0|nr:MerR family transcriptional regulator [Clostridium estertheticum]MBU3187274.1 MerR family transcriptional regulator [Clostridium estertheticum]